MVYIVHTTDTETADRIALEILAAGRAQDRCRGLEVPRMAIPIHLLGHFCSGMYRLARQHHIQTDIMTPTADHTARSSTIN